MPDTSRDMSRSDLENLSRSLTSGREYIGVDRMEGPLLYLKNTHAVGYRELAEIVTPDGETRLGLVLD